MQIINTDIRKNIKCLIKYQVIYISQSLKKIYQINISLNKNILQNTQIFLETKNCKQNINFEPFILKYTSILYKLENLYISLINYCLGGKIWQIKINQLYQTDFNIEDKMYEVEQIVGKRIDPITKAIEYRVKWVNYPPEQNTWQPEKNLKFVKNLIKDFNQKNEFEASLCGTNTQIVKNEIEDKLKGYSTNQNCKFKQKNQNEGKFEQNIYFQQESSEQNKDSNYNDPQKNNIFQQSSFSQQRAKNKNNKITNSQKFQNKNQFTSKKLSNSCSQNEKQKLHVYKNNHDNNRLKTPIDKNPDNLWTLSIKNKSPPPLPPDFSVNKFLYSNGVLPKQAQKSYQYERNKPPTNPIKYQLNYEQRQINKPQPNKFPVNSYKQQKMQPPPPPPDFSKLVQINNSFSRGNSTNNYQYFNTANSKPSQPSKPTSSFNLPSIQQNQYEYQVSKQLKIFPNQPQQQPQNRKLSPTVYRNIQKSPSFNLALQSIHEPNQQHQHQNQHQKQQKFSTIIKVLKMNKQQSGFIYLAETDKGNIWVSRDQLVPRFSTVLVEFYEKYITFID